MLVILLVVSVLSNVDGVIVLRRHAPTNGVQTTVADNQLTDNGATSSLLVGIDKLRHDLADTGMTIESSAESASSKKPVGSLLERSGLVNENWQAGANSTVLRANFETLRRDLGKEWSSWSDLSAMVWPKVDKLALDAKRMDQTLTSAKELRLPSVVGLCAKLKTCSECSTSPICGWCSSSMRCVPGGEDGPVDSSFCATSAKDYLFSGCPGMSCPSYTSCGPCISDGLCGWCASSRRCFEGSEWGPSDHGLTHFESVQPCDHSGNVSQQGDDRSHHSGNPSAGCAEAHSWVHRDSAAQNTCMASTPETTEVDFLKH